MEPASSFAAEMALRSELDVVRLQRLKQAGQVNRLEVRQGTLPWPYWLLIGRSGCRIGVSRLFTRPVHCSPAAPFSPPAQLSNAADTAQLHGLMDEIAELQQQLDTVAAQSTWTTMQG